MDPCISPCFFGLRFNLKSYLNKQRSKYLIFLFCNNSLRNRDGSVVVNGVAVEPQSPSVLEIGTPLNRHYWMWTKFQYCHDTYR